MHVSHPVYGDLVTANKLVRSGRWVFRGTIVPLDDVFADLDGGMSLDEVWEKYGALARADLEAVAARASERRTAAIGRFAEGRGRAS